MRKINRIRKENAAFHTTFNIQFCETDNENLIAYYKISQDKSNQVLTVVNLDPVNKQTGWVKLPETLMPAHEGHTLEMHDLMDDSHYRWNRQWNYVELDPQLISAHIFHITALPH
jgi:starch synthase (maltosyl-transferring)